MPAGSQSLREELLAWLGNLPEWQRDLSRRLTDATHLEGDAFEEALCVVLAAYGALPLDATAPAPILLTPDHLPARVDRALARISAVGSLRGVGVVADDQELSFREDGLTIVYGPNAAGKSTYVGVLKKICRTVDLNSNVRGNVFAPEGEGGNPSARVEYVRGDDRRAQQLDLNDPPRETGLETISVFDSRCAELYLNSQNAVAYVPSSLAILARLAATQDAMRREVSSRIAALERQRPFFTEIDENCEARSRVDRFAAPSELEDLRYFATLGDDERARLSELRAAVAVAAGRGAQADADAALGDARQARALAVALAELATRGQPEVCARLRQLAADATSARQAVEVAISEFAGLALTGVGGDAWARMWEAARNFVESAEQSFPPTVRDPCPLCLQPLDDEAADRLQHFDRHVQSSLQQAATSAEAQLATALAELDTDRIEALRTPFVQELFEREETLWDAVDRVITQLSDWTTRTRQTPASATPAEFELSDAVLEAWAAARDEHARTLLAAMDPEAAQALRLELIELEGRDKLFRRIDDVAAWAERLRQIEALRGAHTALSTNRITSKQRELSARVVTQGLKGALDQEVDRLNCSHLPIDLDPQTSVGSTQVTLRLAGADRTPRVSEILSEGEQRALSLAFFFAEIETAGEAYGIVVDDPVSSLDDQRRSYIAARLTEEAARRQVIVFTHDLPFMLDLVDHAERLGIEPTLRGIWRQGLSVGRVDDRPPFQALRFRDRVAALTARVEQWDNQSAPRDADEAWHRVCDFYADARNTWERGVEERLFRGVVQRFQREVKTLKLRDVVVSDELIAMIDEGMTRCSTFVHDAPLGTRTSLPGRTELGPDVEKLRAFERATRIT